MSRKQQFTALIFPWLSETKMAVKKSYGLFGKARLEAIGRSGELLEVEAGKTSGRPASGGKAEFPLQEPRAAASDTCAICRLSRGVLQKLDEIFVNYFMCIGVLPAYMSAGGYRIPWTWNYTCDRPLGCWKSSQCS